MTFEAVFLLVYADVLLLVALGLDRLGRVNASPWAGRVLAGHRRKHPSVAADGAADDRRDPPDGWPHQEQPRLHTGLALVAAVAALVLAVVGLGRHHTGVPALLFAVSTLLAVVVVRRLGGRVRAPACRTPPTGDP